MLCHREQLFDNTHFHVSLTVKWSQFSVCFFSFMLYDFEISHICWIFFQTSKGFPLCWATFSRRFIYRLIWFNYLAVRRVTGVNCIQTACSVEFLNNPLVHYEEDTCIILLRYFFYIPYEVSWSSVNYLKHYPLSNLGWKALQLLTKITSNQTSCFLCSVSSEHQANKVGSYRNPL